MHGISTTKAGRDLNKVIPIRVFFDWDERIPGFFEIDTVSHDGGNTSGEHIYSLTVTDVSVGWTEIRPLLNKAQRWVKEGIEDIKNCLPYKMLGIVLKIMVLNLRITNFINGVKIMELLLLVAVPTKKMIIASLSKKIIV